MTEKTIDYAIKQAKMFHDMYDVTFADLSWIPILINYVKQGEQKNSNSDYQEAIEHIDRNLLDNFSKPLAIKALEKIIDIENLVKSIEEDNCMGMCSMSNDEFVDAVIEIINRD